MGDGLLRVNFFSGTGVNFGITHVDLLLNKLLLINYAVNENNETITDSHTNDTFSKSIGSLKFDLIIPPNINQKTLIRYIIDNTDKHKQLGIRLDHLIKYDNLIFPLLELFSTFKDGPLVVIVKIFMMN